MTDATVAPCRREAAERLMRAANAGGAAAELLQFGGWCYSRGRVRGFTLGVIFASTTGLVAAALAWVLR